MKIEVTHEVPALIVRGLAIASTVADVSPSYRAIAVELQKHLDRDPAPSFASPARYAKNMIAVRCTSPDGYKTRAARLAGDHLKARYSGREHAYIMSPTKAEKLRLLFARGADASTITGELREVAA